MTGQTLLIEDDPLVVTKAFPYRFGWMPDIHVGAVFGMCTETWTLKSGNPVGPNPGQKILRTYLDKFIEVCKEHAVNILCLPGDVVTGQNWKNRGKYVLPLELTEQEKMCAAIINEICERVGTIKKVLIWKGTGYHGSKETTVEENVCTKLREKYNIDAVYEGEYSWITLEYNGYTKRLFVAHPASSAYMYPEQAMGRDMNKFQEGYAQNKLPRVDYIFRAHKHSYIEVHKPTIRSIQLPCWQYFVPYDKAVERYPMYQPDIGGVITLFDDQLRMTSWHFIYPNIIDPARMVRIAIREIDNIKGELMSDNDDRPPCRFCGSKRIMSRGRQWQCKECGKYMTK